jgi:hypothetical protein
MKTRFTFWMLALLGLVTVGCGRSLVFPRVERCVFDSDCSEGLHCVNQVCRPIDVPDGGLRKRFGEPCDAGVECGSDLCVGGPAGAFCTSSCEAGDAGCPTSYACKALGLPPLEPLITQQVFAADANCPAGGVSYSVWRDTNGNGRVDSGETRDLGFTCNRGDASDGGTLIRALAKVEAEPPGAKCPAGGFAYHGGWDNNGDGVLQVSEYSGTGWECNTVARVSLCAVPQPLLCQGCASSLECGASGADLCVPLDGGSFCGRDCTFEACPALYACRAGADGSKQCVPEGRTCDCVTETLGLQKACRGAVNAFGACPGTQRCQVDGGFTNCDAVVALEESCNGVDDDCNGRIDDFTPPSCSKTVGTVTCTGPQVCMATAGLVCAARPPEAEVCNGQDDDCNGKADEPFVDSRGRYTTLEHCGACGNDCRSGIAHAVSTSCQASTDLPRCRVTQCAPGYFPWDDGRLCLELPDTLCNPCLVDADCVGPGSRCLTVDGQKVCGRDCSAGSAYPGGCPGGYACTAAPGGASQCTPTTGTCSCRISTLDSTRACTVSTCKGFERCALTAEGAAWARCDVASFNPEICDGRDNNCDGQVDEGYRNQSTGKYETASNCGFCNNDCTKYFSPTLQHTTGVCDTAPTLPACTMGPCLTETVGATTYEWVNVNGLTSDGCECRRVQGNLTGDLPDRAPSTTAAASWVDENCDGIDGVQTDAIFVSAQARAGGNGSRTAPFQTITQGLAALQSSAGRRYVLVAQGLYRENVRLFEGAQVFGGYSSDFLKRDPKVHSSQLVGVEPGAAALAAIHAEGLGQGSVETVVAGFTILGWDVATSAPQGAAGQPSIAVYLREVGPRLVLQSNDVLAGRGGSGGRGNTGAQGFGRQASSALNGARGANSVFFQVSSGCTGANQRVGGAAGVNTVCGSATGGTGGGVVCPVYAFAGNQGQQQQYVAPPMGDRNGRGGWDWSFDTLSGSGCGHVTESGWPSNIQQHDGEDGKQGGDGSGGQGGAGAGAAARFGSIVNGRWVASLTASAGQGGLTALGGGGGGAGGGVARFPAGGCQGWEIGATGGGGGAGACGGSGGLPGGAGGASIALLIATSGSGAALPTLLNNRIQRGNGGNGGDGGFGGAGGLGGSGGFGGLADRWSSSIGGKGGEGGNGGPGGGGGGGVGGPAFGVLGFNVDLSRLDPGNTFLTAASVLTGGAGGAGGSSPGANTSTGGAGASGASANVLELNSCAPTCALGSTCDGNGVCVPN